MPSNARVELDPNAMQNIEARVSELLNAAAEEGANVLRDNLSGQGRTGIHWSNLPYPSSAPGEFPTEQFGDLVAGVYWEGTKDPLVKQIGVKDNPLPKLLNLELAPESEGGRKFMYRTFSIPETRQAVARRMREKAR